MRLSVFWVLNGLLYLSDSRLKEKTCRKFVEPEVVGLKPTTNHLTTINKFLFLPDGAMIPMWIND
jgi:hypothetical protein